jgi:hypothetical protein
MTFADYSTSRPNSRVVAWLLFMAASVILPGCGETNPLKGVPLYPVQGKVLLADGKPLATGTVTFVGAKSSSTANLDGEGAYAFKGDGDGGLPEGEYNVRVESAPAGGSSAKTKAKLSYAGKYLDEDASGLKATVTSDVAKNHFDFKLEAADSASSAPSHRGR